MVIKCNRGKPRFGIKTTKSGKKIRLAFCGNKVVEAKNVTSELVHSHNRKMKNGKIVRVRSHRRKK